MGKCFAELLQIAEIVGGRIPVLSAKSFWVISLTASMTFTLNFIITESFLSFGAGRRGKQKTPLTKNVKGENLHNEIRTVEITGLYKDGVCGEIDN